MPTSTDITPDLADVGAVLRARTRSDASGSEIGTFDTTTRPNATEVNDYIEQAAIEVSLRLPATLDEQFVPFAKRLAALRAAMFIEISYDPDRTGDGSAYARLQEQFNAGMSALQDALIDVGQGTTNRVGSFDITSPTLAPFPEEIRELIAPPWPLP